MQALYGENTHRLRWVHHQGKGERLLFTGVVLGTLRSVASRLVHRGSLCTSAAEWPRCINTRVLSIVVAVVGVVGPLRSPRRGDHPTISAWQVDDSALA
jgi:hypothetical protein